jgi:hypothetical protein
VCTFAPVPGWNGVIVGLPSGVYAGTWLVLLIPFLEPPLAYILRPLRNAIALPFARIGPISMRRPSLRWVVTQAILLLISCCLLVFIALPSDTTWRLWYAQAEATTRPECQAALEAIRGSNNFSAGLIAVSVLAPFLVVFVPELQSTYAPALAPQGAAEAVTPPNQ